MAGSSRPCPERSSPALTGFEKVRPGTVKIYPSPVDPEKRPFDPAEVTRQPLPFTGKDR